LLVLFLFPNACAVLKSAGFLKSLLSPVKTVEPNGMHMNKSKLLIWVIASVTAGTALYVILPMHWKYWWYMLQIWIQGDNPFKKFPFWVLPVSIMLDLVLIFKLIASYGIFKLQRWGRTLAIYALSADFLLRLVGFINRVTYNWLHPEMIQRQKEILESALSRGYVRVTTISAIPGYIIGLLSLMSIIILIIRPVKERFLRGTRGTQSENA
jgi:hypothetical protein